jgi:hypothetical protein
VFWESPATDARVRYIVGARSAQVAATMETTTAITARVPMQIYQAGCSELSNLARFRGVEKQAQGVNNRGSRDPVVYNAIAFSARSSALVPLFLTRQPAHNAASVPSLRSVSPRVGCMPAPPFMSSARVYTPGSERLARGAAQGGMAGWMKEVNLRPL